MGCKYIVIDHLSILVSETAADGDERKNIDVLMTKLKRLTEELQIHISIVSHLNRSQSSTTFEQGATPSLANLRGSGSIAQLAHQVYAMSRNQQDEDPLRRNTTKLTVLKNRFCGRTGDAGLLYYDEETGRMQPSILTLDDFRAGLGAPSLAIRKDNT
jgi:twinkle protein